MVSMKARSYLKIYIIFSGVVFLVIFVLSYFSLVFLNQRLQQQDFQIFLVMFGIPVAGIVLVSGLVASYIYFIKYKNFLKKYEEEYDFLVSKYFSDSETRKISVVENIFKGVDKDETGVYTILPKEDEFGEFGRIINLILSDLYNYDIEKSRLLAYQKEVINRLLNFISQPIVIIRKAHRKKSNIIVANLNMSFLNAIKAENVVRLAKKLFDMFKVKQTTDKYLYDLILELIRNYDDIDSLKEIFIGQEVGIEEFLVDVDWFFSPYDGRSRNIISFVKDLIKGSDFSEIDKDIVLEVLKYDEYRKTHSFEGVEGFVSPVAPEDEDSFIKKNQELFYREGVKVEDFVFTLGKTKEGESYNEPVFKSDMLVIPATSRHFSPERMLIVSFYSISLLPLKE